MAFFVEKNSTDSALASPEEKTATQASQPELTDPTGRPDPTGRRQSVALNIVENPLKVSLAVFTVSSHSSIIHRA